MARPRGTVRRARTEHARACQDDNAICGRRTDALARAASRFEHRPSRAKCGPGNPSSGAGGRYELAEPLLALRGVLARALGRPEQAVEVALEAARQARKAGDLPNAMSALHNIKRAAATCARAMSHRLEGNL